MISNKIRVLRAERKMTQEELAYKVGVSRNTIGLIENEKSIPNLLIALKISKEFDMPVNDIFFIDNVNRDLQNTTTSQKLKV